MMKRIFLLGLILLLAIPGVASPRVYGKSGTATTTNATITVPFNPGAVCVLDDSSSIDLYINFTGVATTADGVGNFIVKNSDGAHCYSLNPKNVSETFTIGIITSSSTAAYRIEAIAR